VKRLFRITAIVVLFGVMGCSSIGQATVSTSNLIVKVLYPTQGTRIAMGQALRTIIEVRDEAGMPVSDAHLEVSVADATGSVAAVQTAQYGDGEVYRSEAWMIPHRSQAGTWTINLRASREAGEGTASASFEVKESLSEMLLHKYGFWVDAPRLHDIDPMLMKEQGNAENGAIIWGGVRPMQHIYLENWLEVQWRRGDFHITAADQARAFMLGKIGNFGVYPVRELGQFQPVQFKQWAAWLAPARGQLAQYDEQWMIFYAPEVDRTYVIGTMVALPPPGIDAHGVLRDGFAVHPEVQAEGTAPDPLPVLLPALELTIPSLGERFLGTGTPIVLMWKPMKDLAADEYYQVEIDYNYKETNTVVDYATRQTEFSLPAELYDRPNCAIFNWQVRLMRKTGVGTDGQPQGEPISYNSLYWYVQWLRPPGTPSPFVPVCPNPQT